MKNSKEKENGNSLTSEKNKKENSESLKEKGKRTFNRIINSLFKRNIHKSLRFNKKLISKHLVFEGDFDISDNNDSEKNIQLLGNKRYRDEETKKKISFKEDIIKKNIDCPYLGTIKRHLLDFDFEKVCSISLSNLNVYACLVCGKYYQGSGKKTNAYVHSLQEDHHLFINLNDEKIICLPESYEVIDNSLFDIKSNLKPKYSDEEIKYLDKNSNSDNIFSLALDGSEYIPGYIGLNNIKKTDYVNVIIQSLCRVTPLRNYFLKYDDQSANLVNI